MAVLERVEKMRNNETLREVVFNNGSVVVKNVPHKIEETQTYSGKFTEYTMRGSVSLKLSAITEFMEENGITIFDFNDYNKYPEIEKIIIEYM